MASSQLESIIFRHLPCQSEEVDVADLILFGPDPSWESGSIELLTSLASGIHITSNERIGIDHVDISTEDNSQILSSYIEWSKCAHSLTLYTDSALGSAIGYTCRRSKNFVESFKKYCLYHNRKARNHSSTADKSSRTAIIVYMCNPKRYWLDFNCNGIVRTLVYKHIAFEDGMAWLNTLGGGYSALGDYFKHHAKSAAQVSLQQLKIAMEIGDPGLIIRCRLYYSQSLMQRGHLRQAKHAIRHLYNEGLMKCSQDHRLRAMCHGLWNRLKYCYTVKASAKSKTVISNGLHTTNGSVKSS